MTHLHHKLIAYITHSNIVTSVGMRSCKRVVFFYLYSYITYNKSNIYIYSISKINLKIYSLVFAHLRMNLYLYAIQADLHLIHFRLLSMSFFLSLFYCVVWLHLSNDCNAKQLHGYRNSICI